MSTATISDVDVALAARLRLSVVRLARRVRQRAQAGVTPTQLSALATIERLGPMQLGDLASHERIGRSSVTRLVAKLEANGLIGRRPHPDDGRSAQVALTGEGRRLLSESRERADAYLARQVAALDADEQDRLAAALPVLERLLDVKA